MRTIQLVLDENLERALNALAQQKGRNVEDLVREGVELLLRHEAFIDDPAWDIIALGEGDVKDLACQHDTYIAESLESEGYS